MIATLADKPNTQDIAQNLIIQEARLGNHAIVIKVLLDWQHSTSVKSFLAAYTDENYLRIARLVLKLRGKK